MKKENLFTRLIIGFNVTAIIVFIFSRIYSIFESKLSYDMANNLDAIIGTYYLRLNQSVLILNIIFFLLAIMGIYLIFKRIKLGKILLAITAIFFFINSLPDFLAITNLLFFILIFIVVNRIINKYIEEGSNG